MRVYVTKEITGVRVTTYEVDVPDEVIEANKKQRELGYGPSPLQDFIEKAEGEGNILNLDADTEYEWVSTDVTIHDHDCSKCEERHEPVEGWDY